MVERKGSSRRSFLILHTKDNTVTVLQDLEVGKEISLDLELGSEVVVLRQDIQYAYKFAGKFIPKGADVIKYGEVNGVASADIDPGEHVYVHNVDSKCLRKNVG